MLLLRLLLRPRRCPITSTASNCSGINPVATVALSHKTLVTFACDTVDPSVDNYVTGVNLQVLASCSLECESNCTCVSMFRQADRLEATTNLTSRWHQNIFLFAHSYTHRVYFTYDDRLIFLLSGSRKRQDDVTFTRAVLIE